MNAPHRPNQDTKAATKMNVGLPQPPVFKTLAEERQHRKERLADAVDGDSRHRDQHRR